MRRALTITSSQTQNAARVLHINDYAIDAGGGAEVVMGQTIALLREAGVVVETFTCDNLADPRLTPLRYISNRHAQKALAAKLAAFRPDVVHLHNYYHLLSPGILATLADYRRAQRLRVVMTAHDYHLVSPNSGGSWFRWWSKRREDVEPGRLPFGHLLTRRWDERTCFHAFLKVMQYVWSYRWHHLERVIDLVICPSRFVERMMAATGLPTCRLPPPLPALPVAGPLRAGPLRLVFAGRIEPEKGLNEFLHMLPADFDAAFTIIGAGSALEQCQTTCAARQWSGRVEFVGRLPHPETLARIAGAHVLVQPSRVLETYGLTLIEALSQRTNVLAANRGAAREIIEETGVGFLYEPDDAASLGAQLQAIRQQHLAGTLNRFDISAFLAERSETSYLERLLAAYEEDGTDATRRNAA
jgi:glycosyltransferase involved in cell wall biosynthesis